FWCRLIHLKIILWNKPLEIGLCNKAEEYHKLQPKGHKALSIMNKALVEHDYLVGNKFTIADIALYAYTHVAEEGGFDLKLYPNIQEWCQRIQKCPKYVSMVE
ncbi:glutathione binding-like protein, partial [Acinetobacter baumannii]